MLTRSQEMEDTTLPIVTLCLIADRNRCPANFTPITKANDDGSDADLWKDGFGFGIFNRVVRYIAISRVAPPDGSHEVITDMAIISDKEAIPTNFVCIDYTVDSKERALKKKWICVRFTARNDALDAVTDIIVQNRTKKPPKGYTLAGDVDGAHICFRVTTIPASYGVKQNTPAPSAAAIASTTSPSGGGALYPSLGAEVGGGLADGVTPHLSARSSTAFLAHRPLEGVAFTLSPRYALGGGAKAATATSLTSVRDALANAERILDDEYTFSAERIYVN